MLSKEQLIEAWLEKAEHDLGTAKITLLYLPEYADTICFHCQQAVEKYLKAYLIHLDIEFRRTHDLVYLLELINEIEDIDELWFDAAAILNDYAVHIRYPDENRAMIPTNDELLAAIQSTEDFKTLIYSKLSL